MVSNLTNMCYGVFKLNLLFMEQEQKNIHLVIAVISILICIYLSLALLVWMIKDGKIPIGQGHATFVLNPLDLFMYVSNNSHWLALIFMIFSLGSLSFLFMIQPICEVLGAIVLWVYCLFDRDSDLFDDFEIKIIREEEPRYRSSGTLRWRNSKYNYDDCDDYAA